MPCYMRLAREYSKTVSYYSSSDSSSAICCAAVEMLRVEPVQQNSRKGPRESFPPILPFKIASRAFSSSFKFTRTHLQYHSILAGDYLDFLGFRHEHLDIYNYDRLFFRGSSLARTWLDELKCLLVELCDIRDVISDSPVWP
jgi:hypothetical protein